MRINMLPHHVVRYLFIVTMVIIPLVHISLRASAQDGAKVTAIGTKPQVTNSLAWGDWDGDGDLDLALGNSDFRTRSAANEVYENDQGVLRLAWTEPIEDSGSTFSVAWGDWDQDGDLDLAVGNDQTSEESVLIYENKLASDNKRTLTKAWWDSAYKNTTSVAWGDWDRDGDLDLASSYEGEEAIRIYENQGNGTMRLAWSDTGRKYVRKLAWGDWDQDGDLDLTAIDEGSFSRGGSLQLYENQQESGKTSLRLTLEQVVPNYWLYALALGDWDNDDVLDFAVGGEMAGGRSGIIQIYSKKGKGLILTLESFVDETGPAANAGGIFSLDWGDWNNDGNLELAAGNLNSTQIYQIVGQSLQLKATMVNPEYTYPSVAWGDLNNDNYLELAFASGYLKRERGQIARPAMQPNLIYMNSYSPFVRSSEENTDVALHPYPQTKIDFEEILISGVIQDLGDFGLRLENEVPIQWVDWDHDGDIDLITKFSHSDSSPNSTYSNKKMAVTFYENVRGRLQRVNEGSYKDSICLDWDYDGDLDCAVKGYSDDHGGLTIGDEPFEDRISDDEFYENRTSNIRGALNDPPYGYIDYTGINDSTLGIIAIPYVLYDDESDKVARITAEYSLNSGITWQPAVATTNTITLGLTTEPYPAATITNTHVYTLDSLASGFFGRSDTVIFRLSIFNDDHTGPFQYGRSIAYTPPFPSQGTQVLVKSDQIAAANADRGNAVVLRQVIGSSAAKVMESDQTQVARTASNGFLSGRGRLAINDTLTALYPTTLFTDHTPFKTYATLDALPLTATVTNAIASTLVVSDDERIGEIQAWAVLTVTPESSLTLTLESPLGIQLPLTSGLTSQTITDIIVTLEGSTVNIIRAESSDEQPLYSRQITDTALHSDSFSSGRWTLRIENMGRPDSLAVLQDWGLALQLGNLYYTSAAPTTSGLDMHTVVSPGVQTLVVSSSYPFMLFDLDVALEWDARRDRQFMQQLDFDLKRASEFLYDWTNGQVALGKIRVFHDAKRLPGPDGEDHWTDADLRIYASNRLRPSAVQGGVVSVPISDTPPSKQTITYAPGQIYMGAVWNRFGQASGNLGEDWPRTLAHELGHYLLFLEDNYLGELEVSLGNQLTTTLLAPITDCPGVMTDQYKDDQGYGEFATAQLWKAHPACNDTLSAQHLGRSDWETIKHFYPQLFMPGEGIYADPLQFPGPSSLPLGVTNLEEITPLEPSRALEIPIFYIVNDSGAVQNDSSARAMLFKDGGTWLIDLGRPQRNQILARGAEPGDTLCFFAPGARHWGCQPIGESGSEELSLFGYSWLPELAITPVNSTTLQIAINNLSAAPFFTATLYAHDLPSTAQIILTPTGAGGYSGTLTIPPNMNGGYLYIEAPTRDEFQIVIDFSLGGEVADAETRSNARTRAYAGLARSRAYAGLARTRAYAGLGNVREGTGLARTRAYAGLARTRAYAGLARTRAYAGLSPRQMHAPAMSSDGNVILFDERVNYDSSQGLFTLQTLPSILNPPAWATLVGKAYRLATSDGISLHGASLLFAYLDSDVNPGEEPNLGIYYLGEGEKEWRKLYTVHDAEQNQLSAPVEGPGIYALFSSVEVKLSQGLNLFGYTVANTTTVQAALSSVISQQVSVTLYAQTSAGEWLIYDNQAPDWINDPITLSFGNGYYISTTQAITLQLKGIAPSQVISDLPPVATIGLFAAPTLRYGLLSALPQSRGLDNSTLEDCADGAIVGPADQPWFKAKVYQPTKCIIDDLVIDLTEGETESVIPEPTATPTFRYDPLDSNNPTTTDVESPIEPTPMPTSEPISTFATVTVEQAQATADTSTQSSNNGSCQELLLNGGFESELAGWSFAQNRSTPRSSNIEWYQGTSAAILGLQPGQALYNHSAPSISSLYQQVNIPAQSNSVTLRYFGKLVSDGLQDDSVSVLLLNPVTTKPLARVPANFAQMGGWQFHEFDLTFYRGQSILVYFEVFNNNAEESGRTWLALDGVSMQVCD